MEPVDQPGQVLIQRAFEFFRGRDPDAERAVAEEFRRVTGIADMARGFPSLLPESAPGTGEGQPNKLVKKLCSITAGLSALNMPVRAVMGGAFLTAKFHLFQGLHERIANHPEADPALRRSAEHELAKSVYTLLLAGLLWDLTRSEEIPTIVRERAAAELVRLWEAPEQVTVTDFFPVLDAVWRARNRIKVAYGTLVGVVEMFQLVREDCPDLFISFFTRDNITEEETAAFQEFLFGVPQEQLGRLREAMSRKGLEAIGPGFVEETLNLGDTSEDAGTPQALYASHRRRQKAASLRRLADIPGPRHTAEEYLTLHLLSQPAPR